MASVPARAWAPPGGSRRSAGDCGHPLSYAIELPAEPLRDEGDSPFALGRRPGSLYLRTHA